MGDEKIGFMCRTSWDEHVSHDPKGTKIYPSISALKADRKCSDECGVVRVKIVVDEVVSVGSIREGTF